MFYFVFKVLFEHDSSFTESFIYSALFKIDPSSHQPHIDLEVKETPHNFTHMIFFITSTEYCI